MPENTATLQKKRPAKPRKSLTTPLTGHRIPGAVYFDEVRGKTLDDLSVSADAEGNLITLTFNDKTEMTLDIEPGISVGAMLESWTTGNSRVLKRWRRISSAGF